MTMQRVIDILRTERECVERAGTATSNKACDRSCADCDLVLDDKEILEAYSMAIKALEQESRVTPQPDTARIITGKSRGGMTLWYQCEKCNEPIDDQDTFCSGCGRRLVK